MWCLSGRAGAGGGRPKCRPEFTGRRLGGRGAAPISKSANKLEQRRRRREEAVIIHIGHVQHTHRGTAACTPYIMCSDMDTGLHHGAWG